MTTETYVHSFAPTYRPSRLAGTPYRPCLEPGCDVVTLDPLHDIDTYREDGGFAAVCACGETAHAATEDAAIDALACQ